MCGRVRRSPPDFLGGASRKAKPACAKASAGEGGDRGIRTLDTVSRIHTFQACLFNHSSRSPEGCKYKESGAVLPVISLVFIEAFAYIFGLVFLPVGVIFHKPGNPQAPAQSHQPGLQENQQHGIDSEPVKNTVVIY